MSDFAIGEKSFKEKPDISQVFIRAIDRCNHMAAQNGYISESAINAILSTLPMESREWVYDQSDKYTETLSTAVFKKYSGIRLGDPIPLRDNLSIPFKYDEEGNIDLDDQNIISPKLKEIEKTIMKTFKETVMGAAEYAGLTWQSELMLLDGGDVLEDNIERKKTPYRIPDHLREPEELEE